jgi:hypothetical protein
VPAEPLVVDKVPEAILSQMHCARFTRSCFNDVSHLQPLEHAFCHGHDLEDGQPYLCEDLRTVRFVGGIERSPEWPDRRRINQRGDYELSVVDLGDGIVRHYLRMLNPSTGVWHVEGVPPHCRTVAEALAWRNQTDQPPAILT